MSSQYGGPGGPCEGIEMNESASSVVLSPDATATVRHTGDHTLVRVVGEMDEQAAEAAAALVELAVEGGRPVDVDLSGTTFFCAAGVTWLVRLYQRGTGEVRVVAASVPVREVLEACRLPMTSTGGLPSPRHAGAF